MSPATISKNVLSRLSLLSLEHRMLGSWRTLCKALMGEQLQGSRVNVVSWRPVLEADIKIMSFQ